MAYIREQKSGGYCIVCVNVWERKAKKELGITEKETKNFPTQESAEPLLQKIESLAKELKNTK